MRLNPWMACSVDSLLANELIAMNGPVSGDSSPASLSMMVRSMDSRSCAPALLVPMTAARRVLSTAANGSSASSRARRAAASRYWQALGSRL
ncbi:hypothetical protein ACOBQX_01375 [Actinokineospora sp. G85]|uniref:hypothetical protein n=1 Tax=Actinokineospora sp. G85 TaxID=3406626 RepID=UPI003C774391